MTASQQLRDWIDRQNMQDQEAARFLGITHGFLCQLLKGTRRPSLSKAVSIEDKTGIQARSWLLSRVSKSTKAGHMKARKQPGLTGSKP